MKESQIEAWGRGIHRIFDSCSAINSPLLQIRYEPNDLWLEFPFRQASVKTSVKILELLRKSPEMTLSEVAVAVNRSLRAVELASSKLVKTGKLRYNSPQKGGRWEVLE